MRSIRIFPLLLLFLIPAFHLGAQTDAEKTTLQEALEADMRLNMAIPSNPAFQALDAQPSQLLRPSNPQELTVSLSEFFQESRLIVPKNFGMELSPGLLLRNGHVLKDSSKALWLDPLRVSVGAKQVDTLVVDDRAGRLGFGLHYTWMKSGTSFRGYRERLRRALQPLTDNYEDRADSLRKAYYREQGISNPALAFSEMSEDSLREFIAARNAYVDSLYPQLPGVMLTKGNFEATVKEVKQRFRRESWNDMRFDVAAAVVVRSPDTLARIGLDSLSGADTTAQLARAQFWATYSFPIAGTNWLQGVVGTQVGYARAPLDSVWNADLTLNGRLFVGANRVKGFVEGQYQLSQRNDAQSWLGTLGVEVGVMDGLWLHFYAGYNRNMDLGTGNLVTNFNLLLTLPENFGLN